MRRRRKRAILLGLCTRGWLFCLIKSVEKDAFPPSPWLEVVSCIARGKCEEGALAFKKDLSSSTQTNGQNQESGFWKHDGTLMTNSLDSLLLTANVTNYEMIFSRLLTFLILFPTSASLTNQYIIFPPTSLCGTPEDWPQ